MSNTILALLLELNCCSGQVSNTRLCCDDMSLRCYRQAQLFSVCADMDDADAAVVGEDEPAEEPLPVGGVLPSEQRELRGTASGRDAAGQKNAGLKPAQDGDTAEGTDGEAEEAKVRNPVASKYISIAVLVLVERAVVAFKAQHQRVVSFAMSTAQPFLRADMMM